MWRAIRHTASDEERHAQPVDHTFACGPFEPSALPHLLAHGLAGVVPPCERTSLTSPEYAAHHRIRFLKVPLLLGLAARLVMDLRSTPRPRDIIRLDVQCVADPIPRERPCPA